MTNTHGVPIGSKYGDQFGEYEVVGEPQWSEGLGCYVQDVRGPEGYLSENAVPALRIYLGLGQEK